MHTAARSLRNDIRQSNSQGTGASTAASNAAAAQVAKVFADVADPKNGNKPIAASNMYTSKPAYVSSTGKPQEISKATYGGSTGNVEVAQQAAASKVAAAAGAGGTKPTPVASGAASKVIPQDNKKGELESQHIQTIGQKTSATIQNDVAKVAAKAG
eukprot:gene11102-11256_t